MKPFGMERVPTVEEELGYRQPFTNKEREFSRHTIQVHNNNNSRLSSRSFSVNKKQPRLLLKETFMKRKF